MKSESKVQKELVAALNERGWIVLRVNPTSLSFPDGPLLRSGIPDLLAFKTDEIVFIEVKRDGKKPAPLQKLVMKLLSRAGIKSFVWDGTGELDILL